MRTRILVPILLTLSGAAAAARLERDCGPDSCTDIEAEIRGVASRMTHISGDGTGPAPSSSEKEGLVRRRQELEAELAACRRAHPFRRTEANRNGDLDGRITIVVPEGSLMPPGTYSEAVHPAEVRIHFTGNGCTATIAGLPVDPLRGAVEGSGIWLSQPSAASGDYHPNSGRMRLVFHTTLSLTQGVGGQELTPAGATITLAFPGPRSSTRHLHLEGDGVVSGGNSNLRSVRVVFDGTLTALPAPQ